MKRPNLMILRCFVSGITASKHHRHGCSGVDPKGIGELDVTGIRMKDANGFYLDISQPDHFPAPQDLTGIRMNMDNFDEMLLLLVFSAPCL